MSTQTNPPHYRGEPPVNSRDRVERKLPQHHQSASWPSSDQPLPEFLHGSRRRADRPIIPPSAPQLPDASVETAEESSITPQEAPGLSPYELEELEREIMRQQQVRPRRSLAPEFLPPPPPPARPQARIVSGDSMSGLVMRLSLIVTVVVLALLMFAGKITLPASWKATALEPLKRLGSLVSNSPQTPPTPLQPVVPELPRLVIEAADAGNEDEIGLGVKVQGPIEGVTAIVSGIAAGTTLSKGRPWGETGWFVPAAELGLAKLRPPAGFSGTMQYTVSLKMPDAKIADRQTLRLQWSDAQNGKDPAGLRKLESDEIATLLKRGQALFETGDLAGARLLLQRAAEAGDPVAAMAIASTFDPVVLQDLGVRGFVADVGKARYWYEKAREFGSKEAPRRLESLASQGR
jgi:hypothetical protein